MVRAIRGIMMETEPSVKEVLMKLNATEKFVIEDIDDTVIFVKEEVAADLKERVAKILGG